MTSHFRARLKAPIKPRSSSEPETSVVPQSESKSNPKIERRRGSNDLEIDYILDSEQEIREGIKEATESKHIGPEESDNTNPEMYIELDTTTLAMDSDSDEHAMEPEDSYSDPEPEDPGVYDENRYLDHLY